MKRNGILLVLCVAGALSCGPLQGLLPGSQSKIPNRGTVTVREHSSITKPDPEGEDRTTIEHVVTIELLDGRATASISYDEKHHAQSHTDNGIVIIDSSLDETTHAEGKSLPVTIQVDPYEDGTYSISFVVDGIQGTWTYDGQSSGRCVIPSHDCGVPQEGHEQRSADVNNVGGTSAEITLDPREPSSFSGSTTETDEASGGESTTTWDLRGG